MNQSSGMYINFLPAYMRGQKKKTKQNKTNKETKKTNS